MEEGPRAKGCGQLIEAGQARNGLFPGTSRREGSPAHTLAVARGGLFQACTELSELRLRRWVCGDWLAQHYPVPPAPGTWLCWRGRRLRASPYWKAALLPHELGWPCGSCDHGRQPRRLPAPGLNPETPTPQLWPLWWGVLGYLTASSQWRRPHSERP